MSLLKTIWMPFRRVWLDDDEMPDASSKVWAGVMTSLTIAVLLICQIATFNN